MGTLINTERAIITADGIRIPRAKPKDLKDIVLTPMMKEMINRTLSVHSCGALVVWYGRSRIGKTTTGRYMANHLNEVFDEDNPDTFRAIHYEVGAVVKGSGNEIKKGIRSLYQAALGVQMDEGFYIRNPPEVLAAQLVHGLRRKRIQLIIVDEAGGLSADAIRGMNLVRDTAENEGWTLTLVFVGMDDLPHTIIKYPQIHNRIHEWCYFDQYDIDATWTLLTKLHPYFAILDAKKKGHREQVEVIHELCSGLPGLIAPFVQLLDYRLSHAKGEITAEFLRAIYMRTSESMMQALRDSAKPYSPYKKVLHNEKKQGDPKQSDKGSSDKK
ncbi:MAG TPA: ATP-binding protein [Pyrinomonadaceae bacterium]|jgi:hypothetical protein